MLLGTQKQIGWLVTQLSQMGRLKKKWSMTHKIKKDETADCTVVTSYTQSHV